jgi:hypothetical protein
MIDLHLEAESGLQGYCVDHWGQIRPQFLNHRYKIQYDRGAPQVIIERLARVRSTSKHTGRICWYLAWALSLGWTHSGIGQRHPSMLSGGRQGGRRERLSK